MHPSSLRQSWQSGPWLLLATAFSVLFGLLFLLNIHPVGDGLWYWYAHALRNGQSLYRDLHVPMQPLFFLGTEANQRLFGNGWLASKILAALQVFAYSIGLFLVCRRTPWTDARRAVLLIAVFGMTIMAFYSRFDDFHITGHCMVVYSIYLLLRFRSESPQRALRFTLWLGLLSGLAVSNRLNDGGLLCVSVAACLLVFARDRKLRLLAVFSATVLATLAVLVAATHSSFRDWFQNSVIRAAAIKGGTHHVFVAPFHFPWTIASELLNEDVLLRDFFYALIVVGLLSYARFFRNQRRTKRTAVITAAAALLSLPVFLVLLQQSLSGNSVLSVSDGCTLALYVLLVYLTLHLVHLALLGRFSEWNRNEVLLLLPFGQIFAGAMTSGESFLEAYPPLAIFLLLFPLIVPQVLRKPWRQVGFTVLVSLLAVGSLISKASHPYHWDHYNNRGLFLDRTWYDHAAFGPMYIEKPQLALMQSMCAAIKPSTPSPELLAMPWPYPNYFCNIPPWHGYVQTWYDTTSKQTIDTLVEELHTHPPEWIAYQRSLDMIHDNESAFNNGASLPQRTMDTFIGDQLRNGAWSLPWQQCFGGTDWLVIHTRPALRGESNDVLLPSDNNVNLCSRTNFVFNTAAR